MLDKKALAKTRPRLKGTVSRHVIDVGSRISVRDLRTGELDIYTLVPPSEADISRHWISPFAPLGKAVIGRKAGDVLTFSAPAGLVRIRIESARKAAVANPTGQRQ